MRKDRLRNLLRAMPVEDCVNLLVLLGSLEDSEPSRLFDRGAPLLMRGRHDAVRVREMVEAGIVPTIYVTVYILMGQKFNILIGDGENALVAAIALGVEPAYGLHKTVLCVPGEHELRVGGAWELYRKGKYHISFHSDIIAKTMVRLGVKVAK